LETKRIPPLEGWLTDIDMSKRTIRSSGMPAFVHADTQVPARQARDFHSAAARLLWKTDAFTAEVGQNRRPVDQARAVLLAAAGGKPSDAAAVRIDFAKDLGVAPADWIGRGGREEKQVEGRRQS
jgi:hypothetical protein